MKLAFFQGTSSYIPDDDLLFLVSLIQPEQPAPRTDPLYQEGLPIKAKMVSRNWRPIKKIDELDNSDNSNLFGPVEADSALQSLIEQVTISILYADPCSSLAV